MSEATWLRVVFGRFAQWATMCFERVWSMPWGASICGALLQQCAAGGVSIVYVWFVLGWR